MQEITYLVSNGAYRIVTKMNIMRQFVVNKFKIHLFIKYVSDGKTNKCESIKLICVGLIV